MKYLFFPLAFCLVCSSLGYSVETEDALFPEEETIDLERQTLFLEDDLFSPTEEVTLPLFEHERPSLAEPLFPSLEETVEKESFDHQMIQTPVSETSTMIDFKQVFSSAPWIYATLLGMSFLAFSLWLYAIARFQSESRVSDDFVKQLKGRLLANDVQSAIGLCKEGDSVFQKMMTSAFFCQKHGLQVMIESMKSEAKRSTVWAWQKLGLLQDIAVLAPMLGLLGTVLGMFYAFYDLNRSVESIAHLFDGLGIAVGTTVAGVMVAILAMVLHSIAKYRLIRALARVETEAVCLAHLIDEKD